MVGDRIGKMFAPFGSIEAAIGSERGDIDVRDRITLEVIFFDRVSLRCDHKGMSWQVSKRICVVE